MRRLFIVLAVALVGCRALPVSSTETSEVSSSVDTLSDWQILKMAIAYTESRMNPSAVGKTNDYGVLQITPIYVKEVNRVSGTSYSHADAFSPEKSFEMFELMQTAKNPSHDLDLAIYLHNKAPWYKKEVYKNYQFIKQYESIRTLVKI